MRKANQESVLLVGASGATGRLLAAELIKRGMRVKAVVRSPESLPEALRNAPRITVIHASLLELDDSELERLASDCIAIASCLGHNLSWKGLFGPPYRLVTEATRRLSKAMKAQNRQRPGRFVLMNTTGNSNRDLDEPTTLGQRIVIGILRRVLPPHADNEDAADYLRVDVGQDDRALEWCVVRPDALTNDLAPTEYELFPSPVRDPIFDSGKTSRMNVARFMADLITDDDAWQRWRGQMPVVYDK